MQCFYAHVNKAHNTVNIHLNKNADFYSGEILKSSFNKKFNQYDLTTGYSSVKIAYAFYLNWHDASEYFHNIQSRIIKNIQAIFPELHNAILRHIFS